MKNNSLILLMGILATEGVLWMVAPGLATMAGVVLGLFVIASWREGSRMKQTKVSVGSSVNDFQRRLGVAAL